MEQKHLELLKLMLRSLRAIRVGTDLELAECAIREERVLRDRITQMESQEAPAEPALSH
jgi:hypothetical protein